MNMLSSDQKCPRKKKHPKEGKGKSHAPASNFSCDADSIEAMLEEAAAQPHKQKSPRKRKRSCRRPPTPKNIPLSPVSAPLEESVVGVDVGETSMEIGDEASMEIGDEASMMIGDEASMMIGDEDESPLQDENSLASQKENEPFHREVFTEKRRFLIDKGERDTLELPAGWMSANHNSGIIIYWHPVMRVATASRPYDLRGAIRGHRIPLVSVPCLNYRRGLESERILPNGVTENGPAVCPMKVPSQATCSVTSVGIQATPEIEACATQISSVNKMVVDTPVDGEQMEEVPGETAIDTPGDTAMNVNGDTAIDRPIDTATNITGDTAMGAPGDTAIGAPGDTAMNVNSDTAVDVPVDTAIDSLGDTATDRPADTTMDITGDTAIDSLGDTAIDRPADTTMDITGDTAIDSLGDTAIDRPADTTMDITGDTAIDSLGDTAIDRPADTTMDITGDTAIDVPVDTSIGAAGDTAIDASGHTAIDRPADTAIDAPVDTTRDAPVDTTIDAPVDTAIDAPVDTTIGGAGDTSRDVPTETVTILETPAQEETTETSPTTVVEEPEDSDKEEGELSSEGEMESAPVVEIPKAKHKRKSSKPKRESRSLKHSKHRDHRKRSRSKSRRKEDSRPSSKKRSGRSKEDTREKSRNRSPRKSTHESKHSRKESKESETTACPVEESKELEVTARPVKAPLTPSKIKFTFNQPANPVNCVVKTTSNVFSSSKKKPPAPSHDENSVQLTTCARSTLIGESTIENSTSLIGSSSSTSPNSASTNTAATAGPSATVQSSVCPFPLTGDIKSPDVQSKVVCAGETHTFLKEEELYQYCKNLFQFREVDRILFRKRNAKYEFLKQKKEQEKLLRNASDNMPLIKYEVVTEFDADGQPCKKREGTLNPHGKTYVCILHEYCQVVLRTPASYQYEELTNERTPYSVTVSIQNRPYATGYGQSKKAARIDSARRTLEMLIPNFSNLMTADVGINKPTSGPGFKGRPATRPDGGQKMLQESRQDFEMFDSLPVTDRRVYDLSTRMSLPTPGAVLSEYWKRNCIPEDASQTEMIFKGNKRLYSIKYGDILVSSPCHNKREGKHRAAQALLARLHPELRSWGGLLRLYGPGTKPDLKAGLEEIQSLQTRERGGVKTSLLQILKEKMRELGKQWEKGETEKAKFRSHSNNLPDVPFHEDEEYEDDFEDEEAQLANPIP